MFDSGTPSPNPWDLSLSRQNRSISGTYVSVEPYHLFRYLDEQAYRFNNREGMNDFDRFKSAASQIVGKRLTWNQITGKGLNLQTRLPN